MAAAGFSRRLLAQLLEGLDRIGIDPAFVDFDSSGLWSCWRACAPEETGALWLACGERDIRALEFRKSAWRTLRMVPTGVPAARVEGEALLTARLAALCGVSAGEGTEAAVSIAARGARVLRERGGKPVVTRKAVGKGIAVAVALKDVPHGLLRPLVIDLAGDLPVHVDPACEPDVRVSALSDGRRCAIGLYNEKPEAKRVTVTLGDLPPRANRVVTNVHRGTREKATDSVTVDVPAGAWLFLIMERADAAPPIAGPGAPVSAGVYAAQRPKALPG